MERLVQPGVITPGIVLMRQLLQQQESIHSNPEIEVMDHQQEAMAAIRKYVAEGGKSGHVEMATSGGKTYLIAMMSQAAADIGMRTLILAPSINTAHQLYGENEQKGLGKFTNLHDDVRVGRRYGENLSLSSLDKPVAITTYQSLNNLVGRGVIEDVDLVLADEAHKSLGELTSQTIINFSPHAIKLGFTATPEYSDEKSVSQILPDRVFSLNIRDSIERGLSPSIHSLIYETDIDIPVLDIARSDFTDRELERLISMKQRNEAIIHFAKDFVQNGLQGGIACVPGSNLAHARLIAEELSATSIDLPDGTTRLIRAAAVGSHISPADNQNIIDAYDRGEIDVLTFVYGLQGWDSDRPRWMINASPTTSMVKESQLLGRLLRGLEDVIFVDIIDRSKKQQVTSLHVLGEDRISVEHHTNGRMGHKNNHSYLQVGNILSSDLYRQLQSSEGKLLSDLYFTESADVSSYLINKWNRRLEQEHLGEDLPPLFEVRDYAVSALAKARAVLGSKASVGDLAYYAVEEKLIPLKTVDLVYDLFRAADANGTLQNIDDLEFASNPGLVESIVATHMLKGSVKSVLATLTDREVAIIEGRFGIDRDAATFDVIADELHLTRERIRQMESKAMARLRHHSRSSELGAYLDGNEEAPRSAVLQGIPAQFYENKVTIVNLFDHKEEPSKNELLHLGRDDDPIMYIKKQKRMSVAEYLGLVYKDGIYDARGRNMAHPLTDKQLSVLQGDIDKLKEGIKRMGISPRPSPRVVRHVTHLRGFVAEMLRYTSYFQKQTLEIGKIEL